MSLRGLFTFVYLWNCRTVWTVEIQRRLLTLFSWGCWNFTLQSYGHEHFTVNKSQKYRQGTHWNFVCVLGLKLCLQEKESVAPCYPQDKETDYWVTLNALLFRGELVFGALLFSGEGNRWSTVLKRTGALLFSGEGNRCPTVLKRSENW